MRASSSTTSTLTSVTRPSPGLARLAHRLLDVPPGLVDGRSLGVLGRNLVDRPVDLLAFVLVVPAWGVFAAWGVFYPLVGADHLESSWGGPTLAGAWFVHVAVGVPLPVAVNVLLRPVSRIQARLAGVAG